MCGGGILQAYQVRVSAGPHSTLTQQISGPYHMLLAHVCECVCARAQVGAVLSHGFRVQCLLGCCCGSGPVSLGYWPPPPPSIMT